MAEALAPAGSTNLVFSPWSVSCGLALLATGAERRAREEIEPLLGAETNAGRSVGALAADAVAISTVASVSEESVLAVVNTLWVAQTVVAVPAFVEDLGRWPGARLRPTSLITDPNGARRVINEDVAAATGGLITEILPPGSVPPAAAAVLVNALYLLAGWVRPFATDDTVDEVFHAPTGTRRAPTMRGVREVRYATNEGWEYVALPLRLGLRAEVLLPPGEGSPIQRPRPRLVAQLRGAGGEHQVDLHLPRFRVSAAVELADPLRALGVTRIFEPAHPALSAVVEGEPLAVSNARHAAVLRVDERGIEAAAATAQVASMIAYRLLPRVTMRVDRPFWLFITHPETGAVLFLAHLVDPV
jgi:serpin B